MRRAHSPDIEMTDDEIDDDIAKSLGWTDLHKIGSSRSFGIRPGETNRGDNFEIIPNYCGDLNAMHEALQALSAEQFDKYRWILWDMVKRSTVLEWFRAHLSASARECAEAYLRALNLWKE